MHLVDWVTWFFVAGRVGDSKGQAGQSWKWKNTLQEWIGTTWN